MRTESYSAAQASLELSIVAQACLKLRVALLCQPPIYWDSKCEPPRSASLISFPASYLLPSFKVKCSHSSTQWPLVPGMCVVSAMLRQSTEKTVTLTLHRKNSSLEKLDHFS